MTIGKEIRAKIKSINSTKKITRAMEMVAASKMKKAQQRMFASRPYVKRIRDVISHVVTGRLEFSHPYLIERPAKRIGIIVVSTDRGLCGGLNVNLFRLVLQNMQVWKNENLEIDFGILGQKAELFFSQYGAKIIAATSQLGDAPRLRTLLGSINVMLAAYEKGEIDRLYLASNSFVNTMNQQPNLEMVLPIVKKQENIGTPWDYIYEPIGPEILNLLLMRYLESIIYQGVVENIACEQAARMVAMKSASDNAGQFIDDLQLCYNKARQSAITQEIAEIVGGAAAV